MSKKKKHKKRKESVYTEKNKEKIIQGILVI